MANELKQVELMQADVTANGITFSNADLQGIADAHNALGLDGKVPLKLGHNDEQPLTDGKPALGWARNLRVMGDKLVGDLTDLPKVIYEAFKSGHYKNVSVEILRNVQAGTRIIPWVLDAVALLGADQPAFGNLKDLQSLTMARGRAPKYESRATFTLADPVEQLRAENATLRLQMRRQTIDAAIEADIRTGLVAPAARELFRQVMRLKGDGDYARVEVSDWASFARTQPKPRLGPAQRTVVGTYADDDALRGDGTAGDQLNRLCEAEVEAVRVKFGRTVQLVDVAATVWRRHPELVRTWHEEQNH